MNLRLPLVLPALVASLTFGLMGSDDAEAQRVRFSGGVRWSGGVSVSSGSSWHFARPAWRPHRWHVGGSIYVGPVYRYRPYYVYYPTYVPSYYHTTSYYPVAPSVTVSAPGTMVAVAPRRPLPKLGIGLFAGGSAVEAQDGGSTHESDDLGLLGRFRITDGLIIEGEMGKMSFDDGNYENVRVDRRLGASLLYEIGARNRWAPYLLAGIGVQQAEVGGQFTTTQDYGEIGAGIRWAVSPKFHLAFELRAGSRATVSSDEVTTPPSTTTGTAMRTITPPTASSDETEEYSRARLSAILYF